MKKIQLSFFLLLFLNFSNCILYDVSRSISDSLGSISTSLESISKSLTLASESISDSFKSDKQAREIYQKEIEFFTEFSIKEKLNSKEYIRGLNRIARKHNLLDWERDQSTYFAIGKGIRNSNISIKEFYSFLENISNPEIKNSLELGYNSK